MTTVQRLQRRGNIVQYDIWNCIGSHDLRMGNVEKYFESDLLQAEIDKDDIGNLIWFIDCGPEGIDAAIIQPLFYYLTLKYYLPRENFRVAFTCVEDVSKLQYPAICIPDRMAFHGGWYDKLMEDPPNWYNFPTTHQVVCLMRRPSLDRALLGSKLLKIFNRQSMMISLGSSGDPSTEWEYLIAPYKWPLTLDGIVTGDESVTHNTEGTFLRAAINLIAESSSQIELIAWNSVFITEKTYKAFAWRQFPIWYAMPGTVAAIRAQGFDVFDDIFENHFYDKIVDPHIRMDAVVDLVKRVCIRNDVMSLRTTLMDRLDKNGKHFDLVRKNVFCNIRSIISNFLKR